MTKKEILDRIEMQCAAQKEINKTLNALSKLPTVSADVTVLGARIGAINATIFDTMSTLALILCEMLPEKETEKAPVPKKGDHFPACNPDCLCVTCVHDNTNGDDGLCCDKHGCDECHVSKCPDYVKEDPDV